MDLPSTPGLTGPHVKFDWPGHSGPLHLRLYPGAPGGQSDVLMVFFHPGGFVVDDLDAADGCLRVLAEACGINILAPAYALAPDRPFPAAVEDAHAVLSQTALKRSQLGWRGRHLVVGGVEAGGNLAAVSALVCRDRQGPKLAAQILVMPMLDATLRSSSMRHAADQPGTRAVAQAVEQAYRSYLPRPADRLHPYASPLNASRLSGLPAALVLVNEGDPLSDEGLAYADKLCQAGNRVSTCTLPAAAVQDSEDRCAITADDPCVTAIAHFLHPYHQTPPGPAA